MHANLFMISGCEGAVNPDRLVAIPESLYFEASPTGSTRPPGVPNGRGFQEAEVASWGGTDRSSLLERDSQRAATLTGIRKAPATQEFPESASAGSGLKAAPLRSVSLARSSPRGIRQEHSMVHGCNRPCGSWDSPRDSSQSVSKPECGPSHALLWTLYVYAIES